MRAANVVQGIAHGDGGIAASLGEMSFGAEQQPFVLDADYRDEIQSWPQNTGQTHGSRVGGVVGAESDVHTVHADVEFIDEAWTENMGLGQSKRLPNAGSRIAESWN